jgi:hypothetical protein
VLCKFFGSLVVLFIHLILVLLISCERSHFRALIFVKIFEGTIHFCASNFNVQSISIQFQITRNSMHSEATAFSTRTLETVIITALANWFFLVLIGPLFVNMCCEQVEWNFKHLTLTKFQKSDKQRPELKDKPTPNFIDSEDARAKSMHQVITEEMFPRRKGDLHADKKHQSSGKDKKPKSPGKDKKNSEKGADPSNKIDMADLQVSFWV